MDFYCCAEYPSLTYISPVKPAPHKSPKRTLVSKQQTKADEKARKGGTKEE